MINKLTRKIAKEMGFDFDELVSDFADTSYQEHRRNSDFWNRSVVEINEKLFPELPRELDGDWETNTYLWDANFGYDEDEIYELNRVVQKVRVIKEIYWEKVENKESSKTNPSDLNTSNNINSLWVNCDDRLPTENEWFVAYINGVRLLLRYNVPNRFWMEFTGKTYRPNEIDKWLDA